jgi:enterochelin esterase-like enzyme
MTSSGTSLRRRRLRVLDGGHDWDVWEPAFAEGLPYVLGAAEAGLP